MHNPRASLFARARARANKLARGLCIYCNKRPRASTLYCTECLLLNGNKMYVSRQKARQETIIYYGGKCECCGEDRIGFLTIDHINGGGNAHRRSLKKQGAEFCKWLIKQGFPEGYRVLCFNCNCAIYIYGTCPHKMQ